MTQKITLVDLRYPYGKPHLRLNGSLVSAAAVLHAQGHTVHWADANQDSRATLERMIRSSDVVGVSAYGAPYIPVALAFAQAWHHTGVPIVVGGQAAEALTQEQFAGVFAGTNARSSTDYWGEYDAPLLNPFCCSQRPIFHHVIPAYQLREHFARELPLFVSQGCNKQCTFCAAAKARQETFVQPDVFRDTLDGILQMARGLGFTQLSFYASSLDFFQNPKVIAQYLRIISEVSRKTGVLVRLRCLSCMDSFLRASTKLPDFATLIRDAGLWSIGFGVDGADESVWRRLKKYQNDIHDVAKCLDLCTALGIRPEVLLVMGFSADTPQSLWNNMKSAIHYVRRWRTVILRPYLAKELVPGNEAWLDSPSRAAHLVANPDQFFNLDFASIGSQTTHPDRAHRLLSNLAYLSIIAAFTPTGNCDTPPYLPQGEPGIYGLVARRFNALMPADK